MRRLLLALLVLALAPALAIKAIIDDAVPHDDRRQVTVLAGLLVVVAAGGRTGAGLTAGVIATAVVVVSRLAVERVSLGKNRPESGVSQDS